MPRMLLVGILRSGVVGRRHQLVERSQQAQPTNKGDPFALTTGRPIIGRYPPHPAGRRLDCVEGYPNLHWIHSAGRRVTQHQPAG